MKKIKNNTGVKVRFFPAELEYNSIKNDLHAALDYVGKSGVLINGKNVVDLEEKLSKLTQSKYCITCASGTDAILLGLKALGIKPGDEVIVPANAYPTVFGVALSGAIPKLIDVEKKTGSLNPLLLNKLITKKTKAVILVHLYGLPADISVVRKICKEKSIILIEDCAQAFGSKYKNKPIGSFGDLAIFSFYPTKNLGALGDGGAIVTSNKNLYNKLLMLRMYGEEKRYESLILSGHSRLDELQAAFLLKKIKMLNNWIRKRRLLARTYKLRLTGVGDVILPEDKRGEHTYHLFVIQTQHRDKLRTWLTKNGIETGIHYPKSIHMTETFSKLGKKGNFPVSEAHNKQVLSLPLHPFLTETQINYVSNNIINFFKSI